MIDWPRDINILVLVPIKDPVTLKIMIQDWSLKGLCVIPLSYPDI